MHIHDWLDEAATDLKKAEIPTAQLDAELILSHTLGLLGRTCTLILK